MATNIFGAEIDLGFVDKRRSASQASATPLGSPTNYADMTAIDARLFAISATSYSASRLNIMNLNDKIYALRLADDLAGI